MQNLTKHLVPMRDSISTKLLLVVFSIYFIVTLTVTLIHMSAEYANTKDSLKQDLKLFGETFENSIANAVWNEDNIQLKWAMEGMLKIPIIVGIKVFDDSGNFRAANGMILNESDKIEVWKNYKNQDIKTVSTLDGDLFSLSFPISFMNKDKEWPLGQFTLYSSSQIVLYKVKYGFIFIIVNSVIKTFALWVIFIWVSRKQLNYPLAILTSAATQVNLNNLEFPKIEIYSKKPNELTLLAEAFNSMFHKLSFALRELFQTSGGLKLANRRMKLLLSYEIDIAATYDLFSMMIIGTNAIINELAIKRPAEVHLYFMEVESNNQHGYTHFQMNTHAIEDKVILKMDGIQDVLQSYSYKVPLAKEVAAQGCFIENSILHIPMLKNNQLLGLIQINLLEDLNLNNEDKDFLQTIAQFLSISIENVNKTFDLERTINIRTRELRQVLAKVEQQNLQLKSAQSQMVHTEKMTSLGTLVAGIAHEINNPLNFISGGVSGAEQHGIRFKEFLINLTSSEEVEIRLYFEDQFKKFEGHFDGIREGLKRISTVIHDLRSFSRLDESSQKKIKLEDDLSAVVRLVKAQYHKHVIFNTDFPETLEVDCWPAELNQLFVNLMLNGCESIVSKNVNSNSAQKGIMTIKTFKNKNQIGILFQDNGCGMTDEVQKKMFDPFFTTKPVGKGTGLGLSVSFGIVQKHHGQINVESAPGVGTTITIYLPAN